VKDSVHAVGIERCPQRVRIEQVGGYGRAAPVKPADAKARELGRGPVEDEHPRALVEQPLEDPRADEALRPREQHARVLPHGLAC